MTPRITLRDVAHRAKVHVSTVSLALRNSPRLPEITRGRIRAIAKEMGYVHDALLDALLAYRDSSRRRSNPPVLAYVTSCALGLDATPHHHFYWQGARRRAAELGFVLEHFPLAEPGMTESRLSDILRARGISGIILSSFVKGSAELKFDWSSFATVRIELQPAWPSFSAVAVDHVRAIIEAVRRAFQFGYRRPGFMLVRDWSQLVEDHWQMGFLWAQQLLASVDRLPILFLPIGWKETSADTFRTWYLEHRPDVLLGPNFHIETRLRDLNLQVPRDIAVVDPFLEGPHEFYAGILHNFEEVGARAIESLVVLVSQNIRGIPEVTVRSYVDGVWQPGPSCPVRSAG